MKNEHSLKKNIYIFAIGTICTKVIKFVLVPLLTFYLSTEQYGTIDLLVTSISLIIPICSLSIHESLLRFGADDSINHKTVYSTGLLVVTIGITVAVGIGAVLTKVSGYFQYFLTASLFMIGEFLLNVNTFFIKGRNRTIIYVLSNFIYAVISITSTFLLISVANLGIDGYFLSGFISYLIATSFVFISAKLWRYISFKSLDKKTMCDMLKYSIPLIANGVSWWLITASDKYMTRIFLNESMNGLLAVVHKIPTLLSLVTTVFSSAFQISALKEYNFMNADIEERNAFSEKYTKYTNALFGFLVVTSSFIIALVEPFTKYFLEPSYYSSFQYVPLYIAATIFSTLASFYSNIFSVAKKNWSILIATIIGAVINIGLCYLFMAVLNLGLYGAALSTLIGFAVVFLVRMLFSQKYLVTKFHVRTFLLLGLISAQIAIYFFLRNNSIYLLIVNLSFSILILIIDYKNIFTIIKKMLPHKKEN